VLSTYATIGLKELKWVKPNFNDRFFHRDDIPLAVELSYGRVLPHQIDPIFARYHQPDLQTEFD
jgi:hypothetical protein